MGSLRNFPFRHKRSNLLWLKPYDREEVVTFLSINRYSSNRLLTILLARKYTLDFWKIVVQSAN